MSDKILVPNKSGDFIPYDGRSDLTKEQKEEFQPAPSGIFLPKSARKVPVGFA